MRSWVVANCLHWPNGISGTSANAGCHLAASSSIGPRELAQGHFVLLVRQPNSTGARVVLDRAGGREELGGGGHAGSHASPGKGLGSTPPPPGCVAPIQAMWRPWLCACSQNCGTDGEAGACPVARVQTGKYRPASLAVLAQFGIAH